MGYPRGDPIARFWSRVDVRGPDDCWLWQGAKQGSGYGEMCVHDSCGRPRLKVGAHHVALWLVGVNTEGYSVHHKCDQIACVNPDHLQAISTGDHNRLHKQRWTKEAILNAIKEYALAYGVPPSSIDWNVGMARARGYLDRVQRWEENDWPAVNIVQREFGSWSNALEEAGFGDFKGKWRRIHMLSLL